MVDKQSRPHINTYIPQAAVVLASTCDSTIAAGAACAISEGHV